VKRSIVGILAVSMAAAACGGGDPMPQAAAAEAAKPVASAPAPPAESVTAAPVAREAVAEQKPRPAARREASAPAARPAAAAPRPVSRPASAAAPIPEYREYELPAGTELTLELRTALASDESVIEDSVRAGLRRAVLVNGREVLPAGTEVAGSVIGADKAGRVKGRARLAFQFTSLRYDGERYPVATEPIEQFGEATKGEDAKKIGLGAGAGAVIGAIVGGGSGAAKGAAIGGGAGTAMVLATRGKELKLEAGSEVITRLAAPLTIRVPQQR
jgi:hypothetical protein